MHGIDSPGFCFSSRKMTINQSTEFEDNRNSSIFSSQGSSQESISHTGPVNIIKTEKYFRRALDANIYDVEQNNYADEEALEARDYFDGPEDQSAQLVSQGKQTATSLKVKHFDTKT